MGLFVAVFGGIFAREIMLLLNAPAEIIELATANGRVALIGMPVFLHLPLDDLDAARRR